MTVRDEMDELREAGRDLAYEVANAVGLLALIRRLGLQPKAWIRERELRELQRSITPEMQAKIDHVGADLAKCYGLTLEEGRDRAKRALFPYPPG